MAKRVCDMLSMHVVVSGLSRLEHVLECDRVSGCGSQHILSCGQVDFQGPVSRTSQKQ